MTHPVSRLLEWLPECDFAVLEHGFAPHGRDYEFLIEHSGYNAPGRHRLIFTHVVEMSFRTEVRDDVWPRSWSDLFTNYQTWEKSGEPDGYVWGTNWSMAYPGIAAVEPSSRATDWAARIQHPMYEATIATDRFRIELVFHDIVTEHIDDRTDLISKVLFPLK
jgi:hypothetical protein